MAVYGPPEKELNQGDLIERVPFVGRRMHDVEFPIELHGLVISHSCDVDKFREEQGKLERNVRFQIIGVDVGLPRVSSSR